MIHLNHIQAHDTVISRITLIVPRYLVKKVKDALEAREKREKCVKIRPITPQEQSAFPLGIWPNSHDGMFYVPTNFRLIANEGETEDPQLKRIVLDCIGMLKLYNDVSIVIEAGPETGTEDRNAEETRHQSFKSPRSLLARTVVHWLLQKPLPSFNDEQKPHFPIEKSLSSSSWTYMVYPPLLLLPPSFLPNVLSITPSDRFLDDPSSLYAFLCQTFNVTHIAINAPIPSHTSSGESSTPTQTWGEKPKGLATGQNLTATEMGRDEPAVPSPNFLRSPTGLTPLYGDFGPALSTEHAPTTDDFSSAFWCTTRQNGIFQTWAPRYTMFSRGNVSEKARILNLKSLSRQRIDTRPEHTSAVDLYAGIGYFAFSYAKAGVGKVLCWEINPWSVEGLKRGAQGNKWDFKAINAVDPMQEDISEEQRFLVFQESNERASRRMMGLRDLIPPVRHVNCGFLPSSEASWEVAIGVLDQTGGMIHAHENVAKKDIDRRTKEIVVIFRRLVTEHHSQHVQEQRRVECEHVERVKSYAPGVIHCVFDIAITPIDFE